MPRIALIRLLAASLLASLPLTAFSQDDWPNRPIRLVVAFAPAGPADIIARLLAHRLAEPLGQNVVVDNRPGAGGNVASAQVARAAPDGYTLLINTSSYAVNPSLQPNLGFDAKEDLTLAALVAASPNLLVTAPTLKAQTLQEVVAEAAAGDYYYGTAGVGTTPHLSAEYLFKVLAKAPATHVPYQGAAPALNAAVSGQTQLASVALPAAVELVKSGRVRGLVVTGSQRSPALPDVPTVAESGFPGFEDITWVGVFAPANTPPAVLNRLNTEVAKLQDDPEFLARLASTGFEPLRGSVEESQAYLERELDKWARVVRETGVQAN